MPFEIVRNDITKMAVDAIVNTANPEPVIGVGTDSMIHKAAGPALLKARQNIGSIEVGRASITPAYNLNAKYVIHAVGPEWIDGQQKEEMLLRSCYENALALAIRNDCRSIAFPLISTGNYGFPKDQALQIAISVFSTFLMEHEMQVYLVVFDRASFQLSEKLFRGVASYIDEYYVAEHDTYGSHPAEKRRRVPRREAQRYESCVIFEEKSFCEDARTLPPCPPMTVSKSLSLADMLKQADAGFTETLLKRIAQTGKKDSEIYKKANISKQHFSKIRSNPDYKPTKPTAIALALALELDLEETRDLIGRAGYALTNSSKFDLIICYFIQQKNYNVVEINMALYEFDQPLLGA